MQHLDGMRVRRVILSKSATASLTFYKPFQISLGRDQILKLRKLVVTYVPSPDDLTNTLYWVLLQKDERDSEVTFVRSPFSAGLTLKDDNDVLTMGAFTNYAAAIGVNKAGLNERQVIEFDPPFIVARSPSMEFDWGSAGSSDVNAVAELFYTKHTASQEQMMNLMKRYVGRKQDVVSNIPRVIDE